MGIVRFALMVGAGSAFLVGCSGGGAKPTRTATSTTLTTQVLQTLPAASNTLVTVNKLVNYEDFKVDIKTADPHGANNLLKLQTQVTNTLTSPQEFNPTFNVTSAGKTYDGSSAKNPTISPAGTVAVELDVVIDSTFTTADAVITFGNTTKNQAMAPLGSSGAYVPLLDVPFAVPAPVTAGEQVFTFTAARLSAYQYDGSQLDSGTEELILTMTVKNNDPQNSYAVNGSDAKFVNGGELLNSSDVRDISANAGGIVNHVQFYADIDNYKAGDTITMTIVGANAQGSNVSTRVTLATLPTID